MSLVEISKRYALSCHSHTNHLYDGKPYDIHLYLVEKAIMQFIKIIPVKHWDIVVSSGWCHDTIEDTRQTYNNVKSKTNEWIADIVYAVTNEKGKTRKERANAKYYRGIRRTCYSSFIKLADRIANVEYGKNKGSKMYEMYKKENSNFIRSLKKSWIEKILYPEPSYDIMIKYLNNLFID